LNGYAPNSQGRRVWSLARKTLNVKVEGQRSRSLWTKTVFFGPFGGLRAAQPIFGKTSLAYLLWPLYVI